MLLLLLIIFFSVTTSHYKTTILLLLVDLETILLRLTSSLSFLQLYCCPQYERLIKFELAQRTDKAHLVDEMIDIKPHPPYGTKAARRAAKERAAERAREREMERQRAAGANPTNFYACKCHRLDATQF